MLYTAFNMSVYVLSAHISVYLNSCIYLCSVTFPWHCSCHVCPVQSAVHHAKLASASESSLMQKKGGKKGKTRKWQHPVSSEKDRHGPNKTPHQQKAPACTRGIQPETSPSCPAVTQGGDVTLLADTTLLTNRSLIQTERSVNDITALLSQQTW